MQQLSVGDRIMHPIHGVGQVIDIKHQELVAGFEHYYVIKIPAKRLTTHIPADKLEEFGIRPVMPQADLAQVLDILRSEPHLLPKNILLRQRLLRQKLETGHPTQIAEAVRDLTWQEYSAHLTKVDLDLLDWGRDLLANEIALVTNTEVAKAKERVETTLRGG